ncbi:MAG: helix-turn-helix domain-containing protein [Tunicatimonas sp.]|uniref:helix-turn-helix domain-containing protein n=1 Tax=Tunicatimonas sp. TaxID=1940096 RepID=UPI003C714572
MKIHKNAQLTVKQRQLIQQLYHDGQAKKSELARRFNVNRKTIDRWVRRDSPYDRTSGPKRAIRIITTEYRQAIISHRQEHPTDGPITIAFHLKEEFPVANRGTVQRVLQQEGLTRPVSQGGKKRKG